MDGRSVTGHDISENKDLIVGIWTPNPYFHICLILSVYGQLAKNSEIVQAAVWAVSPMIHKNEKLL